jgi:hypothetical protein
MTLVLTVRLSEYQPEEDDDGFAWCKQHGFLLTTEADPTDEVTYIALLYAREAMKEWRLRREQTPD